MIPFRQVVWIMLRLGILGSRTKQYCSRRIRIVMLWPEYGNSRSAARLIGPSVGLRPTGRLPYESQCSPWRPASGNWSFRENRDAYLNTYACNLPRWCTICYHARHVRINMICRSMHFVRRKYVQVLYSPSSVLELSRTEAFIELGVLGWLLSDDKAVVYRFLSRRAHHKQAT